MDTPVRGDPVRSVRLLVVLLLASLAQAQDPARLASIHTIYVPTDPTADSSTRFFVDSLRGALMQWEKLPKGLGDLKQKPKGDCVHGYPSTIPGVTLICTEKGADAVLVGGGSRGPVETGNTSVNANCRASGDNAYCNGTATSTQYQVAYGTASLFDLHNQLLWQASRTNSSKLGTALGIIGTSSAPTTGAEDQAALKAINQLRKDILRARKLVPPATLPADFNGFEGSTSR